MFQFLIGWLQTDYGIITDEDKYPVSIPYRLATNFFIRFDMDVHIVFQFLIGWLQTKDAEKFAELIAGAGFNSL